MWFAGVCVWGGGGGGRCAWSAVEPTPITGHRLDCQCHEDHCGGVLIVDVLRRSPGAIGANCITCTVTCTWSESTYVYIDR